jgi:hypothetical protein
MFKIDLKLVSDHIGTRSVLQVRSHLQKIQMREKKKLDKHILKEKINGHKSVEDNKTEIIKEN